MKIHYISFCGLFISSAFLLNFVVFVPSVSASTLAPSEITQDMLWNKAGSPYIVKENLSISDTATLTIEPGVVVKIDGSRDGGGINISASGKVVARGTLEEPIYFTDLRDDSIGSDTNADGSTTHAILPEDSLHGWMLWLYSGAAGSIFTHVNLSYTKGFGVEASNVVLDDVSIEKSQYGILGGGTALLVNRFKANTIFYNAVDHSGDLIINNSLISNVLHGSGISLVSGKLTMASTTIRSVGSATAAAEEMPMNAITLRNASAAIETSIMQDGTANGIEIIKKKIIVPNLVAGDISVPANLAASSSFEIHNSVIMGFEGFGITTNSATAFVEAGNNWWGDASGPSHPVLNPEGKGSLVSDNVAFSPWLASDPSKVVVAACCSNVLFLPGLEASRLYKKGVLAENQLWEPNYNADVEKLYLTADGKSKDAIYTNDIIKKTNIGIKDIPIYQKFSDSMDALVKNKIINQWKAFPYDWRLDLNSIISSGSLLPQNATTFLLDQVQQLAKASRTGKVILIAHSNGGLLAKIVIQNLLEKHLDGLVDQLVMVAVPQLGTPQAVAGLLHGDAQKLGYGLLMNNSEARQLGENMTSAYTLLPSEKYLTTVQAPIIEFDSTIDKLNNWRKLYGSTISDPSTLRSFLTAAADHRKKPTILDLAMPNVLSGTLYDRASDIHKNIDTWQVPQSIKVSQVAGIGLPTLKSIKYSAVETCILKFICSYDLHRTLVKTTDGDETVQSVSATALPTDTYFTNIFAYNKDTKHNISHKDILEIDQVDQLLGMLIQRNIQSLPAYITYLKPVVTNNKTLEVSVHSPVTIDAYDENGLHTGKISSSSSTSDREPIEVRIPNSSYSEFEDGKYITLNNVSSNPKIVLQGTDTGTFTFRQTVTTGAASSTIEFVDIPVTSLTKAEIVLGDKIASTSLNLDVDGDGKVDEKLSPSIKTDKVTFWQKILKIIQASRLPAKIKDEIFMKLNKIFLQVRLG